MHTLGAGMVVAVTLMLGSDAAERPEQVQKLIRALRSKDAPSRISAANDLGKLGEEAEDAASALCDASIDPIRKVSAAALQALEKVRPDLYPHVSTIVLDSNSTNRHAAFRELGKLRSRGSPASGIVLAELKSSLANDARLPIDVGFGGETEILIRIMKSIDPENTSVLPIMRSFAAKKYQGRRLRSDAIKFMMEWAGNDEERRKEVFPLVKDAINDEACQLLCVKLAGEYGADAKSLLPQIKKLKLSNKKVMREAADRAVEQIEAAP